MVTCEVKNLKKLFGKTVACDDISFTINGGEILGLIGANGAGKTTAINSIVGLVVPDAGDITIFNEDALKNGGVLRKDLGFSSGEPSYLANLTVYENLKFVAEVKGADVSRINYLAETLELDLTKKAKELSLGNKKKLSIIMALVSSPKLIILDEPTEGLDPLIKQSFFKLIEEEKARGAGIMLSSHSLADVQRLCDRVAIISHGNIIATEDMEHLKMKRLKIVTIETENAIKDIKLEGITELSQEENITKFNYNGDMKKLVKYLNSIDIVNVQITDADLEKIFLHFYE